MKTSAAGLALIKRFEGLELEAYQDVAGIWTIGYGHTGPEVKPGLKWTEQVAEAALTLDLESREDAISRLVTAPLSQHKFDALVSFVFNVGIEAFRNSTVRKRINAGDSDASIAEAWGWWNKARVGGVLQTVTGLANRREAEIAFYLQPDDVTPFAEAADDGHVKEPGRSASVEPSIVAPESLRNSKPFLRGILCGKFW